MTEEVTLNYLLSKIQENYTTIRVRFAGSNSTKYTYKCAEVVEIGDYCIVIGANEVPIIAKVVGVDETPQIEKDFSVAYKWILGRVDRTKYDARLEEEQRFYTQVKLTKRKSEAEDAAAELRAMGLSDTIIDKLRKHNSLDISDNKFDTAK